MALQFKLINVAYKVLSDPHARLAFASYGAEGVARMDEYNAHGAELDETAKARMRLRASSCVPHALCRKCG